jgi:fructuronate reductase
MDGSQKLPLRLLGMMRELLRIDRQSERLVLGVADWICYVGGIDERGLAIDVRDPLSSLVRAILDQAGGVPRDRVLALLAITAISGSVLPRDARFKSVLICAYTQLLYRGARGAVANLNFESGVIRQDLPLYEREIHLQQ